MSRISSYIETYIPTTLESRITISFSSNNYDDASRITFSQVARARASKDNIRDYFVVNKTSGQCQNGKTQ
jgi:hypothetical protein